MTHGRTRAQIKAMPAAERTRLNDDTREHEGLCVNCTRDWRPIATAFLPRADSECMARRTRELTTALDEHRTALARGDDAQAKFDVVVAKRVQRCAACPRTLTKTQVACKDEWASMRRAACAELGGCPVEGCPEKGAASWIAMSADHDPRFEGTRLIVFGSRVWKRVSDCGVHACVFVKRRAATQL